MVSVKCSKIELVKLKKRLFVFNKYLPTLKLKKLSLQIELNRAKEAVVKIKKIYEKETHNLAHHAALLRKPDRVFVFASLNIEKVTLSWENIVGIFVPVLEDVSFTHVQFPLIATSFWLDDLITLLKKWKYTEKEVEIAVQRKDLLEKELRSISIRVNLFEKRLIPELEKSIAQISIFLGDQDLQSIAQAKLAKKRLFQKSQVRTLEVV